MIHKPVTNPRMRKHESTILWIADHRVQCDTACCIVFFMASLHKTLIFQWIIVQTDLHKITWPRILKIKISEPLPSPMRLIVQERGKVRQLDWYFSVQIHPVAGSILPRPSASHSSSTDVADLTITHLFMLCRCLIYSHCIQSIGAKKRGKEGPREDNDISKR